MEWIINNFDLILTYAAYVIAIATVIVKATPNTTDNKYLEYFIKVFEILGGNTDSVNSLDAKAKKELKKNG